MLIYSMYSNQFISASTRAPRMLNKQKDKRKKQEKWRGRETRGKISAHFDARKFDFITSAVKRVTIRILMGRLLGLKTSKMNAASDNEILPLRVTASKLLKTHEHLGRIY